MIIYINEILTINQNLQSINIPYKKATHLLSVSLFSSVSVRMTTIIFTQDKSSYDQGCHIL